LGTNGLFCFEKTRGLAIITIITSKRWAGWRLDCADVGATSCYNKARGFQNVDKAYAEMGIEDT